MVLLKRKKKKKKEKLIYREVEASRVSQYTGRDAGQQVKPGGMTWPRTDVKQVQICCVLRVGARFNSNGALSFRERVDRMIRSRWCRQDLDGSW